MRFRYSYQKIVDLKENEKTQAEWILTSAVGKLREEEKSLHCLRTEKEELHDRLNRTAEVRTTASQLMSYQSYINHLDQKIELKSADVRHAERNVVQKQQLLASRTMEEKVWNQAREKAYQQHRMLLMKKEQETLDEMAVSRHKKRP